MTAEPLMIVNFGHPLTDAHRAQIAALTAQPIGRVIDVPTHFTEDRPYAEQAAALITAAGLTPTEWQTLPLLVNLPSFAPIVAVVLARLHGLLGYFPTVLRLRPAPTDGPPAFEIAELVSLNQIRGEARRLRA